MKRNWGKYVFEFLSIFVAVTSAFLLNNWNESRQNRNVELNILTEISNGLDKDVNDIRVNMFGHKQGLDACKYWRELATGKRVDHGEVVLVHYFNIMRDFIAIQNTSGYESLKSKGLELISDDSLRYQIISLYEYEYKMLEKFEEDYSEAQFHESYFEGFNAVISPHLEFDSLGTIVGVDTVPFTEVEQKALLSIIWKVEVNRNFILKTYSGVEAKIENIQTRIEAEIREQ